MIFYEAPHRLTDTLAELAELFGESREMAAVRELTKKFEEVRRATIASICGIFPKILRRANSFWSVRLFFRGTAAGGSEGWKAFL